MSEQHTPGWSVKLNTPEGLAVAQTILMLIVHVEELERQVRVAKKGAPQ